MTISDSNQISLVDHKQDQYVPASYPTIPPICKFSIQLHIKSDYAYLVSAFRYDGPSPWPWQEYE
jgi:hypothetical protein